MSDDPEEKYKSPPASIVDNNDTWGPFVRRKIPLDDYHICPCCDGKGYVGIVSERDVSKVPRRIKRDVSGNLVD